MDTTKTLMRHGSIPLAIRIAVLVSLALLSTFGGCSDDPVNTKTGNAGVDANPLGGLSDLGKLDTAQDAQQEIQIPDLTTGPEDFGQPCEKATDCLSGFCVQGPGGKICSKMCASDCGPGWTCNQVTGASGDTAFICIPSALYLCKPCTASSQCNEPGETSHKCIPGVGGSSFCGVACDSANPDCPEGYQCASVIDPDTGKAEEQCVPQAGECQCSALARSEQATTKCVVKSVYGSCLGTRSCGPAGLSACNAATPAAETCNGSDDDCDGETDEQESSLKCKKENEFGVCGGGAVVCKDGQEDCNAPEPKPESCNGYDDDCDGKTDEGLCDDGNPCTIDTCNTDGTCKNLVPPDAACEDGDACTAQDKCIDGKCVGGGKLDCDDQNGCTVDSCDIAKGCIHAKAGLGAACADDGNPCTADTCDAAGACIHTTQAGICVIAGACVAAGSTDPTDPCKVCNPLQNKSAYVLQNGLACDDSNPCTVADKCSAGTCAGKAMDCSGKDGPCIQGVCSQGACIVAPKVGNCDDGNACTDQDICQEGACLGKPKSCSGFDGACTVGVCESGSCKSAPKPSSCDDGNPCTVEDSCATGACKGTPMDCSSLNSSCGKGVCQGGQCISQAANNGGACSDGNSCTTGDFCSNGQCTGQAKDCSYLNNACGPGVCSGGQCLQSNQGICQPGQAQTESQPCGNCGTQTRTRTCSAQCGWGSWGSWGTCSGQGVCAPGASESQSQGCGNCGTQSRSRTCSAQCQWNAYSAYSTCGGQGVCSPGSTSASCGDPCLVKACSASCQWGACGLKPGAVCAYKNGTNYKCCGTGMWQFCSSTADGGTPACNWYPCQPKSGVCGG